MIRHIQIQCFSKTPGSGDQGYCIVILPPFFNKHGLINIEVITCYHLFKVLMTNPDYSWHNGALQLFSYILSFFRQKFNEYGVMVLLRSIAQICLRLRLSGT